jgi:hypothetical protein
MAEPVRRDARALPRPGSAPEPTGRLDDALARMAARLAGAVEGLGDDPAARFLRSLPAPARPDPPDGGCLDLPTGPPEPVDRLVRALALGPTDRDLLVLGLLGHHHEGVAAVLRALHPLNLPWATVGLAALLAEHGSVALDAGPYPRARLTRILATGPLTAAGALHVDGPQLPFPERSLRPEPLLWDALAGLPGWPTGVEVHPGPFPEWGFTGWLDLADVGAARRAVQRDAPVTVLLAGPRPRQLAGRLAALVASAGREAVVLQASGLDAPTVSAVLLFAAVRGVVPVIGVDGEIAGPLAPTAPGLPVPLLLATRDRGVRTWPRPVLELPAGPHPVADRLAALAAALPGTVPGAAGVWTAAGGPATIGPATIEPGELELAAADVRLHTRLSGRHPDRGRLSDRVDARTAGTVPPGAVLVHPGAGWDDLVLPADRIEQLREAVERMRRQEQVLGDWGFRRAAGGAAGLRLLFAGPPGTGKTLAAEVIAAELGRDLLVVDLSQLVSKWIGETEKNLAAVFGAAERDGAALLFDEADALFGKRTEVADARDRYANLETAYLLARLERFTGVAVLATNLRQNLDAAFARRIEFVVLFDQPDEAARLALWRHHLPDTAPLADDADLTLLAGLYQLPGALIRNAALAAAFLAAAEPEPRDRVIGLRHLVHAVRREHAKAGLPYPGPPPGLPAGPPIRRGPT